MTANELDRFIQSTHDHVFIEAEGIEEELDKFITAYNARYGERVDFDTDGIMLLGDVDKWSIELRLYLNNDPGCATRNRAYRPSYLYRINNNSLIRGLFDLGYRVGLN